MNDIEHFWGNYPYPKCPGHLSQVSRSVRMQPQSRVCLADPCRLRYQEGGMKGIRDEHVLYVWTIEEERKGWARATTLWKHRKVICVAKQQLPACLREKGEDNTRQERVTTYLHTALLTG